ncbi:hypothetical protein ABVT39_025008 [Epinephelus coioides]
MATRTWDSTLVMVKNSVMREELPTMHQAHTLTQDIQELVQQFSLVPRRRTVVAPKLGPSTTTQGQEHQISLAPLSTNHPSPLRAATPDAGPCRA